MSVFSMRILKDSKGLALFMSIALMTVFLFFLSASLYLTRVETKITSNLKLATQTLEVADAGLHHAMALIPDGYAFNGVHILDKVTTTSCGRTFLLDVGVCSPPGVVPQNRNFRLDR